MRRFPFDWKDPFLYALAMTVEYSITMDLFYFVSCLTTLKIGTLLFTVAITIDIKRSINSIGKPKKKQTQIFTELSNFIQFHLKAKQLSLAKRSKSNINNNNFTEFLLFRLVYDLSELFQPICIVLFSWSISEISGCLLLIQVEVCVQFQVKLSTLYQNIHLVENSQEENDNHVLLLVDPILKSCWAFALLYTFCEIGDRIEKAHSEINDKINGLKWYSFPSNLWQMIPMIMMNSQKPMILKCFGTISSGRIVFKQASLYVKNSGIRGNGPVYVKLGKGLKTTQFSQITHFEILL